MLVQMAQGAFELQAALCWEVAVAPGGAAALAHETQRILRHWRQRIYVLRIGIHVLIGATHQALCRHRLQPDKSLQHRETGDQQYLVHVHKEVLERPGGHHCRLSGHVSEHSGS